MRLLKISEDGSFSLTEYIGPSIPPYAILSHTWGADHEEVTFKDLVMGTGKKKAGYAKLRFCAQQAKKDGLLYFWVDTCAIDKSSSAELSEAINSMYAWYKRSRVCYVYLADYTTAGETGFNGCGGFTQSRWWSRGWTLQELIAPTRLAFYDANWNEVGTKSSLQKHITKVTGIDEGILQGDDPMSRNVAVRMSWAARRQTTRVEDRAYCLMGLFGVNMPTIYGEGSRAFLRLQQEIMRVDEDYTLFSWSPGPDRNDADAKVAKGLLADAPSDFFISRYQWTLQNLHDFPKKDFSPYSFRDLSKDCSSLLCPPKEHDPPALTSRGIRISVPLLKQRSGEFYACFSVLLNEFMVCVVLYRTNKRLNRYARSCGADLLLLPISLRKKFKYRSIFIIQPVSDA